MTLWINAASRRALTSAIFLLAILPGLAQAELIDYWPLNEATGTEAHDTVGGLNGVLQGQAQFVAGGPTGGAVTFNSITNDLINMGNVLPLNNGDFSIVGWMKTIPNETSIGVVVGKQDTGNVSSYILAMNLPAGGTGNAYFYDSESNPSNYVTSVVDVNDGNWHQLVGTYQVGGLTSLYVDGQFQQSRPSNPIIASNASFMIGGLTTAGQPTGYFSGLIDGVGVYDTALSAAEVQTLFNAPEPASFVPFGLGAVVVLLVAIGRGQWFHRGHGPFSRSLFLAGAARDSIS